LFAVCTLNVLLYDNNNNNNYIYSDRSPKMLCKISSCFREMQFSLG